MTIFKLLNLLQIGNKGCFDISAEQQLAYVKSFAEPTDDIDRSYKQFLCQEYFVPLWKRSLWWGASLLASPVVLAMLWLKGRNINFVKYIDTIAEDKGMDEIIPSALTDKYELNHEGWHAGVGLTNGDVKYLLTKIVGPRQPYFVLKMIILIAKYSPKVTMYHPHRIIEHSEYSFGSSAITDYLHYRGVQHIDVQHGEKLLIARDAFFHYDECYVWDAHYVNLFCKLRAEPTQFRVTIPPSLHIDCVVNKNQDVYADFKYYLAKITEEEIESIVDSMSFAQRVGKSVKYRIHPRYTDLNVLRKYVKEEDIELPSMVNILESVANVEYAVGSYTTVLLQAYLSGKKVILDDVTYKERFEHLKEYGYILAENDDVERLSERQ